MKNLKMKYQHGFTLVEMAIVLAIVALILGGGLTILSAQQDQRRVEDTNARLSDAQEALIGFAIAYGRLPCPSDPTIASGTATAGQEYTSGAGSALTCGNVTGTGTSQTAWGVLPWATLGISETDAWGHRFTYQVSSIYADAIGSNTLGADNNPSLSPQCGSANLCTPPGNPQFSSFALCSCGGLNILSAATGGTNIATFVPAAIVSHGANGLGAYLPSGQRILPVPVATTNEGDNADNDSNFVSHSLATAAETGGYFDDQVIWLSQYTLFNRMVQAGKLP